MPTITHSHLFRRPLAAALLALVALTPGLKAQNAALPFMDAKLSLDQRLDDLLGRLTLPEKVSLLSETAPAIECLGIGNYNDEQAKRFVVLQGAFELQVGSSSKDIRLTQPFTIR